MATSAAGAPAISRITSGAVADLAAGAALLGSGGGGTTRTSAAMLRAELGDGRSVPLVSLSSLDDSAELVCVGAVGSPVAINERPPHGDEFSAAIECLARHRGRQPEAVVPLEIGGLNALMAVMAASRSGLPLVDADAMGRAFPHMTQTTLSAARIPAAPAAVVSSVTSSVISTADDSRLDDLVCSSLKTLGGWCAVAAYPETASGYRGAIVDGSIGTALQLGSGFRAAAGDPTARADFLLSHQGVLLGSGTVLEAVRNDLGGRPRGAITLNDREDPQRTLRLVTSDEYVCVLDDGRLVAASPQPICVLDRTTWHPISATALRVRQQVDIVAFPASPAWPRFHPSVGLPSYGLRPIMGAL